MKLVFLLLCGFFNLAIAQSTLDSDSPYCYHSEELIEQFIKASLEEIREKTKYPDLIPLYEDQQRSLQFWEGGLGYSGYYRAESLLGADFGEYLLRFRLTGDLKFVECKIKQPILESDNSEAAVITNLGPPTWKLVMWVQNQQTEINISQPCVKEYPSYMGRKRGLRAKNRQTITIELVNIDKLRVKSETAGKYLLEQWKIFETRNTLYEDNPRTWYSVVDFGYGGQ